MRSVLIALTALTLTSGTAYAADFSRESELYSELARWHGAAATPHVASYITSLTEVVDDYWTTLRALGYDATVTGMTPVTTTYTFAGATGVLGAAFTQTDEGVVVTLSRALPRASYANITD